MEIIYILTNEAMPGYVKIGKTSTNLEQRIRELSTSTSVPLPFTCFYACTVADAQFVEHQLHDAFDNNRINPRREFFQIAPERIVSALKLAEIQNITPKKDIVEEKEDQEALKEIRGYDYGVAGTDYWMYDGETLDERRRRIEEEESLEQAKIEHESEQAGEAYIQNQIDIARG